MQSEGSPVAKIQEITGGGADVVFEAIGDPGAIIQAFWSTGMAGRLVIPGITPANQTTNLPLQVLPFTTSRSWKQATVSGFRAIDIPG